MCWCIFVSTAMPPNFIHFYQKVDIKRVLESCGHLRTALFTGFYLQSTIFIFTQCNAIAYTHSNVFFQSFLSAYKRDIIKHLNFFKSNNKYFIKLTQ